MAAAAMRLAFTLADRLRINYYDAEIFSAVLKRLEAEKDHVKDLSSYPGKEMDKANQEAGFREAAEDDLKDLGF